jgi:hypothetical protein
VLDVHYTPVEIIFMSKGNGAWDGEGLLVAEVAEAGGTGGVEELVTAGLAGGDATSWTDAGGRRPMPEWPCSRRHRRRVNLDKTAGS